MKAVKVIKRCLTCLLLFVLLTVSFVGCGKKYKFEKGFGYTFRPTPIMIGFRSDTDSFSKDSVTFDLCYGMHDIDHDRKYGDDPKITYLRTDFKYVFFGLYICDSDHSLDIVNDMEVCDFRIIDNCYFVKKISEEEAFSEEYGFSMNYFKGITYNHKEKITIPEEFFSENKGRLTIKIIAYLEPTQEDEYYYTTHIKYREFGYQAVDNDKVIITF